LGRSLSILYPRNKRIFFSNWFTDNKPADFADRRDANRPHSAKKLVKK